MFKNYFKTTWRNLIKNKVYSTLNLFMLRKRVFILIALIHVLIFSSNACTIFSCSRKGEVFAASNEDDYTPFTRVWYNPHTEDRYGSVCFGGPDMQVASAVNEYGLFFDFAAASYDVSKLKQKNPYQGFLMWDVLGKCKNVREALEIISKYDYNSPSQVLLADREGNSVLINPEGIVVKTGDFQVNANCNLIDGSVSCRRPELADSILFNSKENSVDLHRDILNKTHQEGNLTTLYSTICDLKRGIIYVYFFHDYNTVYKINIKEELQKGHRIEMLADHFPSSFAYENFSKNHPLYRKEAIMEEIDKDGLDTTVDRYISEAKKEKDSILNANLLEVALQLVRYAWNNHSNGGMWDYFFSIRKGYDITAFQDKQLAAASLLLKYLIDQPFETKLHNFLYEMYAYVNLLQGDSTTAKVFYQKSVAVPAETYEVSYLRANEMLRRIDK